MKKSNAEVDIVEEDDFGEECERINTSFTRQSTTLSIGSFCSSSSSSGCDSPTRNGTEIERFATVENVGDKPIEFVKLSSSAGKANASTNSSAMQCVRQATTTASAVEASTTMERLKTNINDLGLPSLPALSLPLPPEQKIRRIGKYCYDIDERPLGTGSYGQVVRAWDSTNAQLEYAIKILNPSKAPNNRPCDFQREFEMILGLKNPKIVQVYEYLLDGMNCPCIVMELIRGGDLFERISKRKKYNENNARDVIKALLEVILYLHENNVAHRDLKPENIILVGTESDTEFKLVDFGIAEEFDAQGEIHASDGTPMYLAPEVLRREKNGKESDIWAIGMIAFVLLWGRYPFTHRAVYWAPEFSFTFPASQEVSEDARDFVKHLLDTNPNTRYDASAALKHRWIVMQSSVLEQNTLEEGLQELIRTQTQRAALVKKKFQGAVRKVQLAMKFKLTRSVTQANPVAVTAKAILATSEEGESDVNASSQDEPDAKKLKH